MSNVLADLGFSGFGRGVFSISAGVFWPYFAGATTLVVGLALVAKDEVRHARGLDKIIPFGPTFFAMAMAIFGADHLTAAKFVAMIVPSFIPWHLFWAYFVGIALLAAALSLVTRIEWRLAAALLGIMIFLFVLLIHIPTLFAPHYEKTRLTILLRDLALSAGALAFAASQPDQGVVAGFLNVHLKTVGAKLITCARFAVAISIAVFGINHFLYPTFAPGIPQENGAVFVTMPSWIPGRVFWAYFTGSIFVACAIGIVNRKWARSSATALGLTVLGLILLVYFPLTIARASDIADGLNYLAIHFALAGAALLLARTQDVEP